ncbi:hypothetical protein C7M84_009949 [Penaeus vannamei]|uniref:TOG domain-containing protein n=1 Tax=Penaeus vannamei TaxID=6689 RepID=A0A3R7P096_PENVA|nr:hypothetical protein C7M84_009949 [Penaeus vannamei]
MLAVRPTSATRGREALAPAPVQPPSQPPPSRRPSPRQSPEPSPRHTSRMSKSKSYTSSLNRTQGREALAEKRHRSLERSLPQSNGVASNAYRTPQLVRRGQPPVNSGSSLSNSFGTTRRTPRRPPVRVVTKAEVPEASSVNVPPGYKPRKPVPSEKPSPVGSQRPRLKHHLAAQFSTDSTRSVDDMSSTMSSVGLRTAKPASSCFKAHLEPFPNPHEALKRAQDLVNSGDWRLCVSILCVESQVEGITNIVRLAEHHPEVLQSDLHQINMGLLKQAKNLRSQVSRASIQAFTLLFDDVEKITSLLLQKTSDTNKFLQLDSNHGLDALVENVSPNKAIPAILQEGLNHKNPAVRTTVARLLTYEVERLGASKVLSGQKDITDRLLPAAAKLAQEGSLETRKYAKHIFQQLSQQGNYDQALKKYVSPNDLRNIQKFLDNLSNEGRTIRESARSKFSVGSRYTRTM